MCVFTLFDQQRDMLKPLLIWTYGISIRFKSPDYSSQKGKRFTKQKKKKNLIHKIIKFFDMRQSCYNLTGPEDIFCLFIYLSRKQFVSQYSAGQLILRKTISLRS